MKCLKLLFIYLNIFFSLFFASPLFAETNWHAVANGLDYTTISINNTIGSVVAFRINLNQYKLVLARAKDENKESANVADLALSQGGIIAINGGFFDPFHNELGLRIHEGKLLSPIRPISWWGIFYIVNNRHAIISSQQAFSLNPNITFAIQSGPRLIVNGTIPRLKESYAARSALGIDSQGRVIIAITSNAAPSLMDFARILRNPAKQNGLGCYNALNLDGGSSSQLYADIGQLNLMIPSFSNVADAVVVVANHPD